ncbi:ribonuclease P protein component [Amycolatopsis antarctica]|uniref:Ribonuclease P protein component n=1 Tax=Amycolatopsis antarctica TaxID=1854586 RepID=A0A263D2I1_9PSEU|nr:ribonuclease P protein component [Amycolatopsis antarctica]OZM72682.1 ribonuclease P protein component [Amycolatopsis antarctica]
MLPADERLRRSEDFRTVIRGGARAGRRRLVVHLLAASTGNPAVSRAGFVVSKAVGNSVVRHRVSRRLRHLVADRLGTLPPGSSLVIRALPPAATASSAELGSDLDVALRRLGSSSAGTAAGRRSPGSRANERSDAIADAGVEIGPTV